MLLLAHNARGYVGAAVFGASLILVYGTSASYHCIPWGERMTDLMRRVDHAMIFVLIVGTYTPFCLMALGNAWGIGLLSVTAGIAGVGALMRLVWLNTPALVGGASVPGGRLDSAGRGAADTAAARCRSARRCCCWAASPTASARWPTPRKRPDPWPSVFGYHEVFHSFTIMGSASHFLAVAVYLLPK